MEFKIGILEGDYIGPEIINEAVKVLKSLEGYFDVSFRLVDLEVSGKAYDKYKEHLPQKTLEEGKTCHALLKGPFGGPPEEINNPKWADVEKNAILPLRKYYNLYTNIREVEVFDCFKNLSPLKPQYLDDVDILIVRELTGGIYFGDKGTNIKNGERENYDVESYTESEIRRITKKAFDIALERKKKKVTLVGKSNVLVSSVLWREIVEEVRNTKDSSGVKIYKDVEFNYMHVDNASMQIILNPKQFDVLLTSNMFGDILSDEASVLSGTIGLFPSASIGDDTFGLYEPIHGSAPDIAGKNAANPMSAILCLPLMFKYSLGRSDIALCIENAVRKVFEEGYRTKDMYTVSEGEILVGTKEMGDEVVKMIGKMLS